MKLLNIDLLVVIVVDVVVGVVVVVVVVPFENNLKIIHFYN